MMDENDLEKKDKGDTTLLHISLDRSDDVKKDGLSEHAMSNMKILAVTTALFTAFVIAEIIGALVILLQNLNLKKLVTLYFHS